MPPTLVIHILPHRGGGGEVYVSMLGSSPEFEHQRCYLSTGRSPRSAAMSLPLRIPALLRVASRGDLIHVHGDAAAIISRPLQGAAPTIWTTHGLHLLRRSTGVRLTAVRIGLRRAVAASCAVIATTQSEAAELAELIRPVDRAKLRVIYNGVPQGTSLSSDDRLGIRAELGVGTRSILGLFAGELEQRKEPMLAVAAAQRLRAAGIPFVLAVAGDGPLASAVRAEAGEVIRPLGFRADLNQLMAASDLFVQTSSREGMSLALLEAMSHGLPVVAADVPGNTEAVSESGLLFAPGEVSALAAAIEKLCRSPSLRRQLGQAAAGRATATFGLERWREETLDTYRSVLTAPFQPSVAPRV